MYCNKKLRAYALIFICLCATMACKEESKVGAPITFKVLSSGGGLGEDLKFGLYVGSPVNIKNVPFSLVRNGGVILDQNINWAYDQSVSSCFTAYCPYDSKFDGHDNVVVDITGDQNVFENIKHADIMLASAAGNPEAKSVNFRMQHAMTALTFTLDNRTGVDIKSVKVSGPVMKANIDFIIGTLTATGDKKMIEPLKSKGLYSSYVMLYPPQEASMIIYVTLKSGKEITIAFDKPCKNYPGMVVDLGALVLTPDTEEHVIVSLDGVGVSKWENNGLPVLPEDENYITLSDLGGVELDDNGVFYAYMHKMTVTAVDKTNSDSYGVILEDSTKAIHAWLYDNTKLEVGNTITGPVAGVMEKYSTGDYKISYLYLDYATVRKDSVLPCTVSSFKNILDKPNEFEYKRLEFKDVTVKESFNQDRAVLVQDGVEMGVVCQGVNIQIASGATGDFVGFPVIDGPDVYVMVYDESMLDGFSKISADTPFTKCENEGLYLIDVDGDVAYVTSCSSNGKQIAIGRYEGYGYEMQLIDTDNGLLCFSYLNNDGCPPHVGYVYNVSYYVNDNAWGDNFTCEMECVKVTDNKAWLVNDNIGLVIAL